MVDQPRSLRLGVDLGHCQRRHHAECDQEAADTPDELHDRVIRREFRQPPDRTRRGGVVDSALDPHPASDSSAGPSMIVSPFVGCSRNRMGSPASRGSAMTTWPGTSTSRYAVETLSVSSVISWLAWTASTTLTTGRFVPAGPVKSSTSTPASKPCSPSNSLNSRNKINKPRSQARVHRKGYGQHIGHADNTTVGSEDTSDNT